MQSNGKSSLAPILNGIMNEMNKKKYIEREELDWEAVILLSSVVVLILLILGVAFLVPLDFLIYFLFGCLFTALISFVPNLQIWVTKRYEVKECRT